MSATSKDLLLAVAERLMFRGREAGAIDRYLEILKSSPDDAILLNTVGDLLVRLARNAEAAVFFGRAAEVYLSQGFAPKAIATLRKTLQISPENVRVRESLGDLYLRQGLTQDACLHFCEAAKTLEQAGRQAEAEALYARISGLKDEETELLRHLKHAEVHGHSARPVEDPAAAKRAEPRASARALAAETQPEPNAGAAALPAAAATGTGAAPSEPNGGGREASAPSPWSSPLGFESEMERAFESLFDTGAGVADKEESLQYKGGRPQTIPTEQSTPGFTSHMDLGNAYREVGLLSDAIREFQSALQFADRDTCTEAASAYEMLVDCCLAMSDPDEAAGWATKGLARPGISAEEEQALLQRLGLALEAQRRKDDEMQFCSRIYPEVAESAGDAGAVRHPVGS